jgi:site-specific recombinase XerD
VPDEETRNDVLESFSEGASEHACARNALMQRVLEQTGLRCESLSSLRTAQFERKLLDECKYERVAVTPEKQKFGYEDSVKVPLSLAYEVCGFIENERADFIRRRRARKPKVIPSDHVFLSEQTLSELKPRSISRTFSRAMRRAGAPLGSAVHSWRHKFTMDKVDAEHEYRLAHNLPLADADILGAVSIELNHRNPQSIRRYLHAARAKAKRRMG